jgi:hypothetical protein
MSAQYETGKRHERESEYIEKERGMKGRERKDGGNGNEKK